MKVRKLFMPTLINGKGLGTAFESLEKMKDMISTLSDNSRSILSGDHQEIAFNDSEFHAGDDGSVFVRVSDPVGRLLTSNPNCRLHKRSDSPWIVIVWITEDVDTVVGVMTLGGEIFALHTAK